MGTRHAKYFGSSKHPTWGACPGSIALSDGVVASSSTYADEGTDAHELAALSITSDTPAAGFVGRLMTLGTEVTDDMASYVQAYVDECNALRRAPSAVDWGCEREVYYSEAIGLPDTDDDGFGTTDFWALVGTTLYVRDLKYGRGEVVLAENNGQLLLYALGLYSELWLEYQIDRVNVGIHQVRISQTVDEWELSVGELWAFAERAKAQVRLAQEATELYAGIVSDVELDAWGLAQLNPGTDQCRWCKAKATCPALRGEMMAAFEHVDASPTTPGWKDRLAAADTGVLCRLYPSMELFEVWMKAVRGELESRVLAGDPVALESYKTVEGRRGNRAWSNPDEAETAMKAMRVKHDQMYSYKLISPTQAEKLAKAGTEIGPKQWTKLKAMIVQPEGALTVVPISDKRPAKSNAITVDAFATLEGENELA